tara:strand:+ start:988 stop:2472 length:1485 start_codon:yes stop_codon:yes gene_type:complete
VTLQDNQATPTHVDYTWSATYDSAGRRIKTLYEPQGTAPQETKTWFDPSVEFLEVIVEHDGQTEWKINGNDLDSGALGTYQSIGGIEALINESTSEVTTLYDNCFGHILAYSEGTTGSLNWHKVQLSGYGALPDFETKALETTGSLAQSLVWQSKSIDPTGLYPIGARCYDPNAARFISPDPLGHTATPDLYSFAYGDPINYFDPTGRISTEIYQDQDARAWSPSNSFLTQSDYHKSQGNGFRAMGYGFLGIMGAVPEIVDHTFSEAGREMGQVRQEIDQKINTGEYRGTQAVLARTLQNFGDIGLGNSSLVTGLMTSPVDTTSNVVTSIPSVVEGVIDNALEAYYDPSLSNTFDVIEDGINIASLLYGGNTSLGKNAPKNHRLFHYTDSNGASGIREAGNVLVPGTSSGGKVWATSITPDKMFGTNGWFYRLGVGGGVNFEFGGPLGIRYTNTTMFTDYFEISNTSEFSRAWIPEPYKGGMGQYVKEGNASVK